MDLSGNTFWEFRDRMHASRPRRIMRGASGARHTLADYSEFKVDRTSHFGAREYVFSCLRSQCGLQLTRCTAQWHQWLRTTRQDPPTISELQADRQRQIMMVERARLAD